MPEQPPTPPVEDGDQMTSRETLELVRAYYRIGDGSVRKRLVDLARALGKGEEER